MLKSTRVLQYATDLSATLKLPKSSFPPRALPERRASYLKQCTDDLYHWQAVNRPASTRFVLHDGPPYANGGLHIGHALNKILKDIFCRFQLSKGKRVHFVPGWDCHGLPIEVKALQSEANHTVLSPTTVRKAARNLATRTIQEQKEGFQSWAIMADWQNAYKTMDPDFEIRQLRVFQRMVEDNLIYRQYKPVYWSPSSGTALAEAELEYDEHHISLAAYIKFELTQLPQLLSQAIQQERVYALIWTTTPWTLPANKAIGVHSDLKYCIARIHGDLVLVAEERLVHILNHVGIEESNVEIFMRDITGSLLANKAHYVNVLQGSGAKSHPIVHADFVSAASGSGLVHMAPGHGFDDYIVCRQYDMDAFAPVDDQGCFTVDAFPDAPELLKGKAVLENGSRAVLDLLQAHQVTNGENLVLVSHDHEHKYPIDWRTKEPLIIRATAQWFANVGSIKNRAFESLKNVEFIPEMSKTRLQSFIAGRNEWCISRQRAWGVPIPTLYLIEDDQAEAVLNSETVDHIIKVIEERGINAWWTDSQDDPCWISPHLPPGKYVRGRDTMDVWFDSGTTWTSLDQTLSTEPPADVYIEGTDQHRGWFQSSLLTFVAQNASKDITPMAPYKTLITHGFTLDHEGRKMSKSLGNVVSPSQIMDGTLLAPLKLKKKQKTANEPSYDAMGPDALRLWVAGSDYFRDVVVGEPILRAVNGSLHKYRVTIKWLLGVLSDYPAAFTSSHEVDLSCRIVLYQLSRSTRAFHAAMSSYEPHKAISALNRFINIDLSASFFEAAKDPLYAGAEADRSVYQATCYEILQQLLAMFGTVCPLLVAESMDHMSASLYAYMNERQHDPFKRVWEPFEKPSFADMPDFQEEISWLSNAHSAVKLAQERARAAGRIRSGLECEVALEFDDSTRDSTKQFFIKHVANGNIAREFVVSSLNIGTITGVYETERFELPGGHGTVHILPSSYTKCPRCWRFAVEKPPIAQSNEHALCGRCTDVVRNL